MLVIQAAY